MQKMKADQSIKFERQESIVAQVNLGIAKNYRVNLSTRYEMDKQPSLGLGGRFEYFDCCSRFSLQILQKPLALTQGLSRKFRPSFKVQFSLDGLGYMKR